MLKNKKLIAIATVWLMVLTTFAIMSGTVVADSRAGEPLPDWDVGTMFWNRNDNTDLTMYTFSGIIYGQPGTEQYCTENQLTPTDDSTRRKYTVEQKDASEYKVKMEYDNWENGTWQSVVDDLDCDNNGVDSTAVTLGEVTESGNYDWRIIGQGTSYYTVSNLAFKRATSDWDYTVTFTGSVAFVYKIDVPNLVETTSSGTEDNLKPTWETEPMKVGDSWTQKNGYKATSSETASVSGDLGGGPWTNDVERNRQYDYTWTVAEMADKKVNNIMDGTGQNTFFNALRITLSGSFDWDTTVNQNSNNGQVTIDEFEHWYGGDGDKFDGGWVVETNKTTRMIWSSYVAFVNSPPQLDQAPPVEVDINEGELWEFINGDPDDYTVTDPDASSSSSPTESGELSFTIDAVLGTNTNVLSGLAIDPDTGDVTLTPDQADVADGYIITINVEDKYTKDIQALDPPISFTLNVKNVNDPPVADPVVMVDFEMNEGEKKTPTWTLAQVFSDPDMAPNPLNANTPYDPTEKIIYSVSGNNTQYGDVRVLCPNGNDMSTTNQCDAITFEAADGTFPKNVPMSVKIKGTDSGGLHDSDTITITVKHVNHAPEVLSDAIDKFELDEDTTDNVLLNKIFVDIDAGNPNYNTGDKLDYDKDGEQNMKISITGYKAKIEPDQDWNGKEEITFEAFDKSNAKVTYDLDIIVNPVNDDPVIDSFEPSSDPTMDETDDATQNGSFTEETFSIVASDVDITTGQDDVITYSWTVEDGDTGEKFLVTSHDSEYIFKTAFDGEFEDGAFHGGDGTKTYIVECVVSDGTVDIDPKKWFVTVRNVNREPIVDGVDIYEVKKSGEEIPLLAKPTGGYSFKYGKIYRMDVTSYVTDLDDGIDASAGTGADNIDKLQFDWTSSIDQTIGAAESVTVGAGKSSVLAEFKLRDGKTHTITVRVADQDGGSDEYVFTVKVAKNPVKEPGFEALMFVAAVGVAVAVLAYRRKK